MDPALWPVVGYGSGWASFVALALLMSRKIANGDWVPRATHEREVNRADHDANEWRTEGRIKDQAILVELEQIKALAEQQGQTLHNFIAGLQKKTGVTSDDGGT